MLYNDKDSPTPMHWWEVVGMVEFHTSSEREKTNTAERVICVFIVHVDGSVDKITDSQSWGPHFESYGSSSSALGQGPLPSLSSPLERT